jgi:pyridoxal phosphate enzyme (YggS family)
LLAVSKTQPADAVAGLAALGQLAFGENYVQEAMAKQAELALMNPSVPTLEWHLIGHLQSNKARDAASRFDWVQSVDRERLVVALNAHRPPERGPLDVLVQVNVDDEASKHGCRPEDVPRLAELIAGQPNLRLRGIMAIPRPHEDVEARRPAFRRVRHLFETLAGHHPHVDTLSMGMSDDLEVAIAEGATMVRVGTALFGARTRRV